MHGRASRDAWRGRPTRSYARRKSEARTRSRKGFGGSGGGAAGGDFGCAAFFAALRAATRAVARPTNGKRPPAGSPYHYARKSPHALLLPQGGRPRSAVGGGGYIGPGPCSLGEQKGMW